MLASDTKESSTNAIVSYLIQKMLARTKLKFEFAETNDKGVVPTAKPVYIRGDAYISDCPWSFEDQQFVNTSFTFTFGGVIEHSS